MPKSWALGAALTVSIGVSFAAAADVTIPSEYDKLIQQRGTISALGDDAFGERIDLSTGGLEIVQTDIDLPGNDALPVRLGRRFRASRGVEAIVGHFGDWDLDLPHMHGEFYDTPLDDAWIVEGMTSPDRAKRCSHFGAPPPITRAGGTWSADEYWHGTSFYLPGSGEQELLKAYAPAHVPGGDTATWKAVTKAGAAARCLASLDGHSEAYSSGEGFEVRTPDGTTYRLDHMVSRTIDTLAKTDSAPMFLMAGDGTLMANTADIGTTGTASTGAASMSTGGVMQPMGAVGYSLPRAEVFLYPTLVTDRFGNTVTYTWDSSNPWRLTQITASDGRQLTFTYPAADATSYRIVTASDGTHTWTYSYTGTFGEVGHVLLPDGQSWSWNVAALQVARAQPSGVFCDTITSPDTTTTATGTITAPTGATATYTMTATLFGRSYMLRQCYGPDSANLSAVDPYLFEGMALTSRTVTGPALPAAGLTWSYAYGPPNNCWSGYSTSPAVGCTSSSPDTRTTTVTDPDGNVSRQTFGNRYADDEGMLKQSEVGVSGATSLRKTVYAYAAGDDATAPYDDYNGGPIRNRGDYDITSRYRPQTSVTTTQQGSTFAWQVASDCSGMPQCFDAYARPTKIVRSGRSGAYARTETTTYHDDTTAWVLGQVASVTCNAATPASGSCDGDVMSATTFDATYALPLAQSAFGKLRQTFGYDTASTVASGQRGTLRTVTDGNSHATTYTSWKRGIPQAVAFADATTRTAVVNDSGWITSTTDENGYATGYGYDAMGRLTSITYPTGDSVAWNGTSRSFAPLATAEYGMPVGSWRLVEHTGNGYKASYYDALWRPVLVREYDAANAAATQRFTKLAYDGSGRVTFASYPSASSAPATGTWTDYDALGRVTSVAQDTELTPSVQATTTTYNTGFTTTVTDARGHATTTSYMAYDQPGADWPVSIVAPENETTVIARDPYGKPLTITRQETAP